MERVKSNTTKTGRKDLKESKPKEEQYKGYSSHMLNATFSEESQDMFFNSITEKVPIFDLFEPAMMSKNDQNMPFCPILVQLKDEKLISGYGGKYLL